MPCTGGAINLNECYDIGFDFNSDCYSLDLEGEDFKSHEILEETDLNVIFETHPQVTSHGVDEANASNVEAILEKVCKMEHVNERVNWRSKKEKMVLKKLVAPLLQLQKL